MYLIAEISLLNNNIICLSYLNRQSTIKKNLTLTSPAEVYFTVGSLVHSSYAGIKLHLKLSLIKLLGYSFVH